MTPSRSTPPARSTASFSLARKVRPEIPTVFLSPKQDEAGRFVQPEFEKTMALLALRGQVAMHIHNKEDAKGEILTLQGDMLGYEDTLGRHGTERQLQIGQKEVTEGLRQRAQNRIAYLEESIERWELELAALKALLSGVTP